MDGWLSSGTASMNPASAVLFFASCWACCYPILHALLPSASLMTKLKCVDFLHAVVIVSTITTRVWLREPFALAAPVTANHMLVVNIHVSFMICDTIGLVLYGIRNNKLKLVYFIHHFGSLIALSGLYIARNMGTEVCFSLFWLDLDVPILQTSRYLLYCGRKEAGNALKQVCVAMDVFKSLVLAPPVLLFVCFASSHPLFKLGSIMVFASNIMWVCKANATKKRKQQQQQQHKGVGEGEERAAMLVVQQQVRPASH